MDESSHLLLEDIRVEFVVVLSSFTYCKVLLVEIVDYVAMRLGCCVVVGFLFVQKTVRRLCKAISVIYHKTTACISCLS